MRTLPAVSSLRTAYPAARIAWLVEPAASGILVGQPWIDEVLVFPRERLRTALAGLRVSTLARELGAFVRALRASRFDLVLDFHAILKSGLLARSTGARLRASYAAPLGREQAWRFANTHARLTPAHVSRFDRNAALLLHLGIRAEPAAKPLHVAPDARARIAASLPPGTSPIALHPGTSAGTPHKRWYVAGYASLARRLRDERGIDAVVCAGPGAGERALADEIVRLAGGAARHAPETASLAELAALFERCRLYVGGDTGPMHVASLVGTPVVQIIGPTDPIENEPWRGTPSRTVRVGVACSPCRRGCSAATCMMAVSPRAVAEAAYQLLDRLPDVAGRRPPS